MLIQGFTKPLPSGFRFTFIAKRGFILAVKRGQCSLGFPRWSEVCDWLDENVMASTPELSAIKYPALKNPEIPGLVSYKEGAGDDFWNSFPFKELPKKTETAVITEVFADLVEKAKNKMTSCEYRRARKVVRDLSSEAEAFQLDPLPPIL